MNDLPVIPGFINIRTLPTADRSSFGDVFLAEQRGTNRTVVIKVMKEFADDRGLARFEREWELVGELGDRYRELATALVHVFDTGRTTMFDAHGRETTDVSLRATGGLPYAAMQKEGESLHRHVVHDGPLTPRKALALLGPVVQVLGLAHAHEPIIIHLDVRPSNILFSENGRHLLLTDFGIAAVLSDDITARHPIGLAHHHPPEVLTGSANQPSVSWDLWSLTVTLWFAVTGRFPWGTTAPADLVRLAATKQLVPVGAAPVELQAFFQTAFADDPSKRYCSTDEWLEALRVALGEPPPPPPPPLPRRRRLAVVLAAATAATAMITSVALAVNGQGRGPSTQAHGPSPTPSATATPTSTPSPTASPSPSASEPPSPTPASPPSLTRLNVANPWVDAGKSATIRYATENVTGDQKVVVQRAEGTAGAWTTISTLTSPSGNGATGPIPMGRQSIRLAVISGSGEVLVASVPRTVFGFATVPLSTLFPGPTGVYTAGTHTFRYRLSWSYFSVRQGEPVQTITTHTCRSAHLTFVTGNVNRPDGEVGTLVVRQETRDPVTKSDPLDTIAALDVPLTPGSGWSIAFTWVGSTSPGFSLNGTASCYSTDPVS